MFDIGFSELMLIAVVALIVIGPERLPKVARTAGHLLGRLQRYVNDVKSDINREMQLDELKKLQAQVEESARSLERSVHKEMQSADQSVQMAAQGLSSEFPGLAATDSPTVVAATTGSPAESLPAVTSASLAPASPSAANPAVAPAQKV